MIGGDEMFVLKIIAIIGFVLFLKFLLDRLIKPPNE